MDGRGCRVDRGSLLWLGRIAAVVALVMTAAFLATPPGRVPLPLRGIMKMLRGNLPAGSESGTVPAWKKTLSFLLVIAAVVVALF